jgi:hypothetical protein
LAQALAAANPKRSDCSLSKRENPAPKLAAKAAASALALPLPTTRHTTSANPFLVMNQPWSFN